MLEHLANLARSLEQDYPAEVVTRFLMRCIFTFFAQNIHLLPPGSFSKLLESFRDDLSNFKPMVESLWRTMNTGGHSTAIRKVILRSEVSINALDVFDYELPFGLLGRCAVCAP